MMQIFSMDGLPMFIPKSYNRFSMVFVCVQFPLQDKPWLSRPRLREILTVLWILSDIYIM
jgi:hypothetical protein